MEQEPIAIVGRGCVVPGALDPDTFWENIAAGRCQPRPGVRRRARARLRRVFRRHRLRPGRRGDHRGSTRCTCGSCTRRGRPCVRQATRQRGGPDAGLVLGNLSYPSAGLVTFAEQIWREGRPSPGADPRNRFSSGLPAHVAARALGLGAGGFALDAACASALYAIKLGCDRLNDGTASLMVAGGSQLPGSPARARRVPRAGGGQPDRAVPALPPRCRRARAQ